MVQPLLAAVRPRVVSRETGEALLLEDVLLPLVDAGACGSVRLVGGPGMGKTTALSHLMALADQYPGLGVADAPTQAELQNSDGLLVYANARTLPTIFSLTMAPWGVDEALEFVQSRSPENAQGVLERVDFDRALKIVGGSPDLWGAALERLLSCENLHGADEALVDHVLAHFTDQSAADQLLCLVLEFLEDGDAWNPTARRIELKGRFVDEHDRNIRLIRSLFMALPDLERQMSDRHLRRVLAVQALVEKLRAANQDALVMDNFNGVLIDGLAARARANPKLMDPLMDIVDADASSSQSRAASVLHATDTGWHPRRGSRPRLNQARLSGIRWKGAELGKLKSVDLAGADLEGAEALCEPGQEAGRDLAYWNRVKFCRANLAKASFGGVTLRSCDLSRANLGDVHAPDSTFISCSLRQACMEGAKLSGATFRDSDLEGAILRGADLRNSWLDDLDLRQVDLEGAQLSGARMVHVNLEGVVIPGLDLHGARLSRARLTGASLQYADLQDANLSHARLARVDLRNADLRGVDFSAANFHMGSTRSGMLLGAPTSWGTRTGFYSEPAPDEAEFAPAPSRVADLRGTDLRGALVDKTDFYRVDLRGAVFTPEQGAWLRKSRAILDRS